MNVSISPQHHYSTAGICISSLFSGIYASSFREDLESASYFSEGSFPDTDIQPQTQCDTQSYQPEWRPSMNTESHCHCTEMRCSLLLIARSLSHFSAHRPSQEISASLPAFTAVRQICRTQRASHRYFLWGFSPCTVNEEPLSCHLASL